MRFLARIALIGGVTVLAGCASVGGTGAPGSADQTTTTPPTQWPSNTYEHVDLWLHGFAMIQDETTPVLVR